MFGRSGWRSGWWRAILSLAVLSLWVGVSSAQQDSPSDDCPPYQLAKELSIGSYVVSVYEREGWSCADMTLVSVTQRNYPKFEQAYYRAWLDPLTGKDITGEGNPDLIIRSYSGGAHCCYSTTVVSLGPRSLVVYPFDDSPLGNCPADFEDIDGDGAYEVVTCDDSFAYKYGSFAASPMVKVILKLVPGQGYLSASPEFPWLYRDDIAKHWQQAAQARGAGAFACRYGDVKCQVLPVVLDLLYSGQEEAAWRALRLFYPCQDRAAFAREIEEIVRGSPFFIEGAAGEKVASLGG